MSAPLKPGKTRHEFFKRRLRELGMYGKDCDYTAMIGRAVEELSEVLDNQGHDGISASIISGLFNQLMDEYETPPVTTAGQGGATRTPTLTGGR